MASLELPPAANVGWAIFLEDYDYTRATAWMQAQHAFVLKSLVAYMIAIFGIKLFLADRKPFSLERPLIAWNWLLSAFSTLGVLHITPTLYRTIRDHGISYTYTHVNDLELDRHAGYWHFLWVCSKLPEFIDTLFIVLRKKPLITMHWWHHVSSAYSAYVCFATGNVFVIWGAYINYFIHSFMYAYYALRSLGFLVPPQIAQVITMSQIVQMLAWNAMYAHLAYFGVVGGDVAMTPWGLFLAAFATNTLLIMWFKFYWNSYYKDGGGKYEKHKMSVASKLSMAKCS